MLRLAKFARQMQRVICSIVPVSSWNLQSQIGSQLLEVVHGEPFIFE